jgi:hypothetical protein
MRNKFQKAIDVPPQNAMPGILEPELEEFAGQWGPMHSVEVAGTLERWAKQLRDKARLTLQSKREFRIEAATRTASSKAINVPLGNLLPGQLEPQLEEDAGQWGPMHSLEIAGTWERWGKQLRLKSRLLLESKSALN